ncbi:hypothetical protein BDU57DRAFT_430826, partial [Ampelomyces quisqualis]
MSSIFSQLAKLKSPFFKVSYAKDYQTHIINHIATDASHPLHETQRRRAAERKREGLWWHVTTGADLTKSSCVRSWARRRVRHAVVDELKARGFDENAKAIKPRMSSTGSRATVNSAIPELQGSLRFHLQAPLIPAKFVDVRAEVGRTLEVLMQTALRDQRQPVGRLDRMPTP